MPKNVVLKKTRYPLIPFGAKAMALKSWFYYRRLLKVLETFSFQGKIYHYFEHKYHSTWINERGVEIPIIWEIVKAHRGRRILEVGNVLSHYFPVEHDIVDKYEKGLAVINRDIVDFNPAKKYNLIISISTLEHIGWDETPRNPAKVLQAVENLKSLLAPGGKMVVTIPIGYNYKLDELLDAGKINFTEMFCLKRIRRVNGWVETNWQDIKKARYHHPFNNANALVIGIINNLTEGEVTTNE